MNQHRVARRPVRMALALGVAVLITVTTSACGGADRPEASDEAAPRADIVTMRLIAFKPATLAVKAGATVAWTQKDAGTHTVTSGTVEQGAAGVTEMPDGRFDSGEIATGETYERTFDEPGTYPYYCAIHPATMRAEVRVR